MRRERIVLFLAAAALVLAAGSMTLTAVLYVHLQNEGKVRRNATCISFERGWQANVKQLTDTYQYLDNLSSRQLKEPLNVAVLQQLPSLEQLVRTNRPPDYCKGKTGLDDSEFLPIPKRPRDLAPTP